MLLKDFKEWFKAKAFGRKSIDGRYAIIEACIIGLFSALAALFLKEGVGWLGGYRLRAIEAFNPLIVLPLTGLLSGMSAGYILENIEPYASGGGIPQVKAVLAGFSIPCSLKVAIVKIISTCLILGGGFTLGRRGPTVHIGAALANELSSWVPTSPEHRRQMIAAGAAAGLAAGFNTPIAGVLFVVEELMRDISGLTLETALIASFIGAVTSRILGSATLNLPLNIVALSKQNSFSLSEIPLYIILGILAGLLGALFNRGILFFQEIFRTLKLRLPWRMAIVGLISGVIIACLPSQFYNNAGLKDFLMAGEVHWKSTAIVFIFHFFLTMLAYSSGAPGGLFAPGLVLGSSLGYLLGIAYNHFFGFTSEYAYAMTGMAAFFTAVVRVPMTAVVIVFEITTDFNLVLPLMIGAVVAYMVAESVFPRSIYDHLLEAKGIKLQDDSKSSMFLKGLTAVDLMQSQVESLASDLSMEQVIQIISNSHHRGFPVLEQGKLVGIFTQSDLSRVPKYSSNAVLREIMTPNPITVPPNAPLSDVLYLLNRYQLSRLPVMDGNKLLGIITRTDIIRAEANRLSSTKEVLASSNPSYMVYQTRSPSTGSGKILIPISNPHTSSTLLKIAGAIAKTYNYELECLHIIKISKDSNPQQTPVNTTSTRKIVRRLERIGRDLGIPLHIQVRVSTDIAATILETIASQSVDMVLMGWKDNSYNGTAIFGDLVDYLINTIPCALILIKAAQNAESYPHYPDRDCSWLIPVSGGPNIQKAIKLLPALTSLYQSSIRLKICLSQVHLPQENNPNFEHLEETADFIRDNFHFNVNTISVCASSVVDGVLSLADNLQPDVVILGVTRESLLKQVINGNIPQAIATGCKSNVILVRDVLG